MNSNDPNATRDWYTNVLGFKLSDTLWGAHMGEMMHFLRCNDWHHSLAIARGPHTSVHHVSFEMRGLDEYMRGTGRVMRAGIKKVWGPGRHLAGNNTFSYFLDPSGNTMEYTTELERLETDAWHPSIYDISDPVNQDQWGTADPMSELIARESFNDPDKGVFVAPPV
jgi:catechol 2,3-dioxygenase-like lactoylglutathione lyase family enzyme